MAVLIQYKLCLFLCVLSVVLCNLTPKEREKVCSRTKHCLWIDDFLKRKHGLPIHSSVDYGSNPDVYCYEGIDFYSPNGLLHAWHVLHVYVSSTKSEGISLVLGNSTENILHSCDTNSFVDHNATEGVYLSPYELLCIGVKHTGAVFDGVSYSFNAKLQLLTRYPVMLFAGLILLFAAPSMSRNVTLYYSAGITIGIVASVLVVLYVFSKFVPKKNVLGLGILAGGYTLIASFFYWLMNHALELTKSHWQYAAVYIVVAGLVSFGVLYRMGPVSNARTFDLIQWSIQFVGLAMLYYSSQMTEVSIAIIVAALTFYWIPVRYNPVFLVFSWLYFVLSCVLAPFCYCCKCLSFLNPLRWFASKPEHRLLTQQEYEEQGNRETAKALKELREYCKGSDMWETIGNLKDSKKFTQFLSGRDHVSAEEKVDHEWSFMENDSDVDTIDYSDYEGDTPSPHPSVSFDSSSHSSIPYVSDESPPPPRSSSHSPRHYTPYSPSRHTPHYRGHSTPYHSPHRPQTAGSRYYADSPSSSSSRSRYGSRR